MKYSRRSFIKAGTSTLFFPVLTRKVFSQSDESEIHAKIDAAKPSKSKKLPSDFNSRVGATHVAGKYHFTDKPFLLEGAEKLLSLNTRLGKFWLIPKTIKSSYPFNSRWDEYQTLTECINSEYFQELLRMPFNTFVFEAHAPIEEKWRRPNLPPDFYSDVGKEFYELTRYLYTHFRNRDVVFILQHWEGDWLLRGRAGEMWKEVPTDWQDLCSRMQKWLAARQNGVQRARNEFGKGAKCVVAHAAEVNRVTDAWKGIPTVTRNVLPDVELDLVSYSAYDGMKDPVLMWKCIQEIKTNARTGKLFGKESVFIGEIGIPENEQKENLRQRWDDLMAVFLATDMKYVIQWELFCNELKPSDLKVQLPVKDVNLLRGFWLIKPDNSLSITGSYFSELWQKTHS
ncbi:MAG: hypothetical protein N2487_01335 [Verrucomicrobiae bacterium]|nr:hypothetical protein [Verrucomicrobiae bacterium]